MIAVIGAGITGLAAAYELALGGIPFTLFEAAARAGGLIRTEQVDGFTIEAGPDSMLTQKPAAIALCQELGLGGRLISMLEPRTAFIVKHGRLHPLPSPSVLGIPTTLRGIARYDLLSWPARIRLALEPFVPRRHDGADESVGSFYRRRFGKSTAGLIADPLLGGIHAGDVDALSTRSLFPRFVDAEATHGSVLRAFGRRRRTHRTAMFRSLASGMGELVAAIERRLPAGSLQLEAPVTRLAAAPHGRWRVEARGAAVDADAVILTVPSYVCARLLGDVAPRAAARLAEIPYVSTASVALAWRRERVRHPLAGSGFVVARSYNRLRISACTWVSSKWPGRAPEGYVLLRAFIGGALDPGAAALSNGALIEAAEKDLAPLLGIDGRPELARSYRWHDAGAQHNVGQQARVQEIEMDLARTPGLFVAGSGVRAVGIPDCVEDGRAAAVRATAYVGRRR